MTEFSTAVKHDDAEIPKFLWNDQIQESFPHIIDQKQRDTALETIRVAAHSWWRRRVLRSFIHHQKTTHGSLKHGVSEEADKDLEAGR
eukprot:12015096-Ditylum_brightwellii.AAC.1